ncbi:hypothetical protein C2S51_019432 [Perilla frutescens var. frutescens]|nr:hypothetical protein C2S51_019432 [Perilla frutescens var. frutescens]
MDKWDLSPSWQWPSWESWPYWDPSHSGERRSSSDDSDSEDPPSSSKVCLICAGEYLYPSFMDKNACLVFFIDLDDNNSCAPSAASTFATSGAELSKEPTFRLEIGSSKHGFCVLGSNLYIFESCMDDMGHYVSFLRRGNDEDQSCFKASQSVFAFDFSRVSDNSNMVYTKTMMTSLPDMPYPIYDTTAIPTPDSQNILVFSKKLTHVPYENIEIIDFLLYHVSTSSWTPLPGIRHHVESAVSSICIDIDSYAFLSEHIFFIKIRPGQMFTLDLLANNDWHPFESSGFVGDWGRFHVIQDTWLSCEAIFTPQRIEKIGTKFSRGRSTCPMCRSPYYCKCKDEDDDSDSDSDTHGPYFELSEFGCVDGRSSSYTTIVREGLCIVRTAVGFPLKYPQIAVDVFNIHGEGVGEGVRHKPITTFKFCHYQEYDFFYPEALFTVNGYPR